MTDLISDALNSIFTEASKLLYSPEMALEEMGRFLGLQNHLLLLRIPLLPLLLPLPLPPHLLLLPQHFLCQHLHPRDKNM